MASAGSKDPDLTSAIVHNGVAHSPPERSRVARIASDIIPCLVRGYGHAHVTPAKTLWLHRPACRGLQFVRANPQILPGRTRRRAMGLGLLIKHRHHGGPP